MQKKLSTWFHPYHAWLFLIPTLLGLLVFRLGPMVAASILSFTNWNILVKPKFVGLNNYKELFSDPIFREVMINTFEFSLIYVIGVIIFGLLLALIVNSKVKGITFFRAAYFTPVVTSAVAVGIVWSWLLSPHYGLVNIILENVFKLSPPVWLGERSIVLIVVAAVQLWKMSGYYMILFLAGLQDIPRIYYEAARIDGANKWHSFWKITLPLLSPTTFFVSTIAIIDSFKNFEIIYTMTQGGPSNATTTLVYSVYVNGFVFYRMGYASAVAYILLIVIGIITLFNFLLKKYWVNYQY